MFVMLLVIFHTYNMYAHVQYVYVAKNIKGYDILVRQKLNVIEIASN